MNKKFVMPFQRTDMRGVSIFSFYSSKKASLINSLIQHHVFLTLPIQEYHSSILLLYIIKIHCFLY